MTRRARLTIRALAVAGLALAVAAAWIHYRLLVDPSYVSPCDVNATFNCSQVYLSRFGSVAGVPVALGGVAWFGLAALLTALPAPPPSEPDATASYLFVLATVGLAAVFYLAYASFFVLKAACLLCLGMDASIVGIFAVSGASASVPMTRLLQSVRRDARAARRRPMFVAAGLVWAVAVAAAITLFPRAGAVSLHASGGAQAQVQEAPPPVPPEIAQAFLAAWAREPHVNVDVPAPPGKIVILKFSDWECPACKSTNFAYEPTLQKYAASVDYVVKDFPLNASCNFNVANTPQGHEASCAAAAAARMAADRGKLDAMAAWLWDNQDTSPLAVKAATERIAGVTDFEQEYAAKLPAIRRDCTDGGVLGAHSTPTIFVNGVRVKGWVDGQLEDNYLLPPQLFELAVKYEVDRIKK